MNRRTLIVSAIAGGTLLAGGGLLLGGRRQVDASQLTVAATRRDLHEIRASALINDGDWTPAQVLAHCAQSVEFSMDGFPQAKPALFQSTVGSAAFAVFASRGQMRHALDEPILGAPAIPADLSVSVAADRLDAALRRFDSHRGPLAPHFAFGELGKDDYALAHAMHWLNHRIELRVG